MHMKQKGLSLVELMVALAIGMLLMLGVTNIAINGNRAHQEITALGQQLENGRYAMQVLTDDLKHAGFFGRLFGGIPAYGLSTLPDPCTVDPTALLNHAGIAVQGYNAPADASALSCLADANFKANTDILVIRRASTRATAPADLNDNEIYIQALPSQGVLDRGSAWDESGVHAQPLTLLDGSAASIHKYRVDIYHISPCSIADGGNCDADSDGGNPIPTLKRLTLDETGQFSSESLVEGIEDLQIDWGIDRNGDGAVDASIPGSSDDDYEELPDDINEWKDVVAAQIHILARNIQPSPGYTDQKTYSFGKSGTSKPGDNYKRHLYSGTVRLYNLSTRRELEEL